MRQAHRLMAHEANPRSLAYRALEGIVLVAGIGVVLAVIVVYGAPVT